jgi:hypothetical protein
MGLPFSSTNAGRPGSADWRSAAICAAVRDADLPPSLPRAKPGRCAGSVAVFLRLASILLRPFGSLAFRDNE